MVLLLALTPACSSASTLPLEASAFLNDFQHNIARVTDDAGDSVVLAKLKVSLLLLGVK